MPSLTSNLYHFGGFSLDAQSRVLKRGRESVPLTPKAFDVLLLLIQNCGKVVTKDELIKTVWPDTFVEESNLTQTVFMLRKGLGETANQRYILTVQGQGYRFLIPVQHGTKGAAAGIVAECSRASPSADDIDQGELGVARARRRRIGLIASATVALILITALGVRIRRARQGSTQPHSGITVPKLTEKDTVVVADFFNETGDPVFDEALKQGLAAELTQSPFFNVASEVQVRETLRRMGRQPNERVTVELAKEVCSRMGGKAVLAGSISRLATHYVVAVQALGCTNGEMLAAAQTEAVDKDAVLKALDGATSEVRGKAGESLPSLEKYNFPLDATTKSLEALKAFSMGLRVEREKRPSAAIPFYQRAIQLDSSFALAYAILGRAYEDLGEDNNAMRHYARAYQLRDRLGEREKYFVDTLYNESVTGDLEQAKQAAELWASVYSKDGFAREKLATVYGDLGQMEKAYNQARVAMQLDSKSASNAFNLAQAAMALNHLDEAKQVLDSAQAAGFDLPESQYSLSFLRGDSAEMERQVNLAAGKPGQDEILLSLHSDTRAYQGRLREATELSARAAEAAKRDGMKEIAATCQLVSALRAAETGDGSSAADAVRLALSLARGRDVKIFSALVLARSGNDARARALFKELENTNPANTLVKFYWAPTIAATLEIHAGNPRAAVAFLAAAEPYELSASSNLSNVWAMYPSYVRGQAYLAANDGNAAAAEFQKVLQRPGFMLNSILGPLSRLQLARAQALTRDIDAARTRYADFLSLWKDADPDIPILKQAKAEYARVQ